MYPLVVLGRNDVGVGIEKNGGEGGVGAGPFEEDKMLAGDELDSLGFKGEGLGLGENEIRCFAVLGILVGRVDSAVSLELRDSAEQ